MPTILCVASFEKGHAFLRSAKALGWCVLLLTSKSLEHTADWPREAIDEIFYIPDKDKEWKREDVILGVSYLARRHRLDRIVALDDFDVETAAALREHLRVPGMGDTTARYFRDKLAMRLRAKEAGIPVPEFVPVIHYPDLEEFMARVPGPWLLKPRFQASALGIRKIDRPEDLWPVLDELGDKQSFYVFERFVPGEVFHVDSLINDRAVIFAVANRYGAPPMQVAHGGGIFSSRVIEYDSDDARKLLHANACVLSAMGHVRGASHTEFIRSEDGTFHFLETSARVGGANIAELVETASGVNLWGEWARVEILGEDYRLPEVRRDYAGLLVSLARQEWPDTSVFNEPEVAMRIPKRYHIALIWRSPSSERVVDLQRQYIERVQRDFHASAPLPTKATD